MAITMIDKPLSKILLKYLAADGVQEPNLPTGVAPLLWRQVVDEYPSLGELPRSQDPVPGVAQLLASDLVCAPLWVDPTFLEESAVDRLTSRAVEILQSQPRDRSYQRELLRSCPLLQNL